MKDLEAMLLNKRMQLFKLESEYVENMDAMSENEIKILNDQIDTLEKDIEKLGKAISEDDNND